MTAWPTAEPIRCDGLQDAAGRAAHPGVDVHQGQRLVRRDHRARAQPDQQQGRGEPQGGVRARRVPGRQVDAPRRPARRRAGPPTTSGRPSRVTARPASGAAIDRAERVRGDAEPGLQGRVAEAALVVQRQHQRQPGGAGEVEQGQADPDRVRRPGEQAQVDQRVLPGPGQPQLAPGEASQHDRGRHDQPGQPRVARPRRTRPRRPGRSSVARPSSTAPGRSSRCRRPSGCGGGSQRRASDEDRDAERHVDEEDQPPAEVRAAEADQRAADQRADRGGDADGGADRAERPAAVGAGEHLLDQPGHLRVDQAAGQALQHPRGDQQAPARGRGRPARSSRRTRRRRSGTSAAGRGRRPAGRR